MNNDDTIENITPLDADALEALFGNGDNVVEGQVDPVKIYIAQQGGVPDISGAELPKGLKKLAPPVEPVKYRVIVDSQHKNVGKCVKVVDNEVEIEVFLHEGTSIEGVNHEELRKYVDSEYEEWRISRELFHLDYDPPSQHTCKFFTAGRDQTEEFDAVEAENYEFDRPHSYPVCSNPRMIKETGMVNPPCGVPQTQGTCRIYVPEPDSTTREWKGDRGGVPVAIKIRKTRRGIGIPEWSVYASWENPDGTTIENSTVTPSDEIIDRMKEAVDKLEITNLEEVFPENEEDVKEKYFDYVLSS